MRKEIEIIEDSIDIESKKVKLTSSHLKDLIINRGLISVLRDYTIPEDFIIKNIELFDKSIVIELLNLSEDFILKSLETEYLSVDDISGLSMATYAGLSKEFLSTYSDNLNWGKVMTYLISSDQISDVYKYLDTIEKYDLWSTISMSGNLPIDFIREYKDQLDWRYLSLTQNFTEDDVLEFSNFIVDVRSSPPSEQNFSLIDRFGSGYTIDSPKVVISQIENL